ncbi:hypothetical protein BC941DRAFT_514720 [Chlamydoabsidia padenii]|nr:hypothetical protein BC941DRAFT_514720 [Chlamydoabsidia padenii]
MVLLSNAVFETRIKESGESDHDTVLTSVYGTRWAAEGISRYQMPADEMPSTTAYQLVKDELQLDGSPFINLVIFVTTYIEEETQRLMTVDTITDFMPDLQHLDLSGNSGITIPAMGRLIKACTKLTHLHLSDDNFFDGTYTFLTASIPFVIGTETTGHYSKIFEYGNLNGTWWWWMGNLMSFARREVSV